METQAICNNNTDNIWAENSVSEKSINYKSAKDVMISYSKKVTSAGMMTETLFWVIKQISSERWKSEIEAIRNEPDKKKKKALKNNTLGYFNIGTFKDDYRRNVNLTGTEFMLFDYDHIQGNLNDRISQLKADPRVYLLFTSPSGDGLKVAYRLSEQINDKDTFSSLYKYYSSQLGADLGETPDKTSDVSRPCFFSYDPNIYVNENAEPLDVGTKQLSKPDDLSKESTDEAKNKTKMHRILQGVSEGERDTTLVSLAGKYIALGFPKEETKATILLWNKMNTPPLEESEIIKKVDSLYARYSRERLKMLCENYWSHGSDFYEFGILGERFFMEKIGQTKLVYLCNSQVKAKKEELLDYVINEKHIQHLNRVDYLGDLDAEKSYYKYLPECGVIEVHYSAIKTKIQDNEFIENYLKDTFGVYKDFIKEYLAVYCYTNYKKLPDLIFNGDRASGKSTFAELVYAIFPDLSYSWSGREAAFGYELEKKFLLVDENQGEKEEQYKLLKKLKGQKVHIVNKKFKDHFEVKNNINIIIMSNDEIPVYVKADEMPSSEAVNQFFVFEFKALDGSKLDAEIDKKLESRIGHYIRTELKEVFSKLNLDNYRYSIRVPITDEEKALFENNVSDETIEMDNFIHRITDIYYSLTEENAIFRKFLQKGYLPSDLIKNTWDNITAKPVKNQIIKTMKKKKLIKSKPQRKIQTNNSRLYCYELTDKGMELIRNNKADSIC